MGEIEAIVQSQKRGRLVRLHAHPRLWVMVILFLILGRSLPGRLPAGLPAGDRMDHK